MQKIFDTFFQVVNKVWPLKILQVSPKMNTIFFQRYTWKLNKRYPFRNPVVVVVVTHTLIKVALGGIFKIVFSRQICEPVLLKRVVWFEKKNWPPQPFPLEKLPDYIVWKSMMEVLHLLCDFCLKFALVK